MNVRACDLAQKDAPRQIPSKIRTSPVGLASISLTKVTSP